MDGAVLAGHRAVVVQAIVQHVRKLLTEGIVDGAVLDDASPEVRTTVW